MDTIWTNVRAARVMRPVERFGAATVQLWLRRARTRRLLRLLITDVRALADLGLSREQVEDEVAKPFWR